MTAKPENPPAFPSVVVMTSQGAGGGALSMLNQGMKLRDWFAGQALIGLLSGDWKPKYTGTGTGDPSMRSLARLYAEHAGLLADAMLLEREKRDAE